MGSGHIPPKPITPPFNAAARAEQKPDIPKPEYKLSPPVLGPDGTIVRMSPKEQERLAGIAKRVAGVEEQLEKDGSKAEDMSKLRRDFDAARDIGR